MRSSAVAVLVFVACTAFWVRAQATQGPVPQPFPGAPALPASGPNPAGKSEPRTEVQPPTQAPGPATSAPPTLGAGPRLAPSTAPPPPAGVPLYPTAEYLGSFNAGAGQELLLYGSNLPYAEMVTFYRTALKTGGNEVFRAPMPPTHQFTLGRYNDERMAFPPSVVIKDYTWNNSPGYLHVAGTTEKRFRTIVQIVPPGPVP